MKVQPCNTCTKRKVCGEYETIKKCKTVMDMWRLGGKMNPLVSVESCDTTVKQVQLDCVVYVKDSKEADRVSRLDDIVCSICTCDDGPVCSDCDEQLTEELTGVKRCMKKR